MNQAAIALCAHGEAAWHAAAYSSLRQSWTDDGSLARGHAAPPHPFLLGAVTLAPLADLPDDLSGILCDSFADRQLPRHHAEPVGHWMIRPPDQPPRLPLVPGLRIRRAITDDDVGWFESLAFLAADGTLPRRPGELHPPGSQHLDGLTLLIGEIDGEGVGTALSVRTARVNNVGAVAVMPAQRGRGIGAALTAAAMALSADLPVTLSATEAGLGVYRRLGFTEVGRPLHHHPA